MLQCVYGVHLDLYDLDNVQNKSFFLSDMSDVFTLYLHNNIFICHQESQQFPRKIYAGKLVYISQLKNQFLLFARFLFFFLLLYSGKIYPAKEKFS